MSQVAARISSAIQSVIDVYGASQYADECAVGVWADDPAAPGCSAVVFQGKLYALVVPDSYMTMNPDELSTLINATIFNAYVEWSNDRSRLIESASRKAGVHAA